MEREKTDNRHWGSFYERTMHLPAPELTQEFLTLLPEGAKLLDFGAGSGAWTSAFLRDRPDLKIDTLDRNIDQAAALPTNFEGQRISSTFEEFRAVRQIYDAIWARSVLFFLNHKALESCFHELAQSLKPNGIMSFTMVDDCHAAASLKFHGMSEESICKMLDKEGFELIKMTRSEPPYTARAIPIPTFDVFARKK